MDWYYYPASLDQIWDLCKGIQKLKFPTKSLIAFFIKTQAWHADAKSPHIVPFKWAGQSHGSNLTSRGERPQIPPCHRKQPPYPLGWIIPPEERSLDFEAGFLKWHRMICSQLVFPGSIVGSRNPTPSAICEDVIGERRAHFILGPLPVWGEPSCLKRYNSIKCTITQAGLA